MIGLQTIYTSVFWHHGQQSPIQKTAVRFLRRPQLPRTTRAVKVCPRNDPRNIYLSSLAGDIPQLSATLAPPRPPGHLLTPNTARWILGHNVPHMRSLWFPFARRGSRARCKTTLPQVFPLRFLCSRTSLSFSSATSSLPHRVSLRASLTAFGLSSPLTRVTSTGQSPQASSGGRATPRSTDPTHPHSLAPYSQPPPAPGQRMSLCLGHQSGRRDRQCSVAARLTEDVIRLLPSDSDLPALCRRGPTRSHHPASRHCFAADL